MLVFQLENYGNLGFLNADTEITLLCGLLTKNQPNKI